jgi:hypothetical protein
MVNPSELSVTIVDVDDIFDSHVGGFAQYNPQSFLPVVDKFQAR